MERVSAALMLALVLCVPAAAQTRLRQTDADLRTVLHDRRTTDNAATTADLKVPLPDHWHASAVGRRALFSQQAPTDENWWVLLEDTLLNSLVEEAFENNYSLMTAVNRIETARLTLRNTRAGLMPTLAFSAGWDKTQTSGSITEAETARESYFSSGLNMSWEADLFGSIRRRVKSDKAALMADKDTHASVRASLAAQVATAYISLREAQQTLKVTEQNCESQMAILHITEARFEAGLASKLDVAQARSVYYSTKATLPQAELTVSTQIATIAVLLGTYPDRLRSRLMPARPMPDGVMPVAVGVPMDLIYRRPDVRSAGLQVTVQEELLGANKADLLPKLTVDAQTGYSAHKLKRMFHQESLTWQVSPTLSWTLFSGTSRLNAISATRVQLREAVEQFNQTVLTAVQEVEVAMSGYSNCVKEMVAMREVCNYGRETLSLSLELYKQGLSPFQNVLDAQRSLLSYENELVQAQGNALLQFIDLCKALGGRAVY
jgi:NodT family efflux transporter outer membrane factor (OMF) lipoprotein